MYVHGRVNAFPKPNFNRKEGNVLFNDALNLFYLRLYVIRNIVKDHSDSEGENPLPPYGHWLVRKTAQWVHHEGSIRRPMEQ